jgi:hypothetical protein
MKLDDLNDMHEAEKTLNKEQATTYVRLLSEGITGQDWAIWPALSFSMVHADASRRREAFLKTIGKWKE